jgi:hypothetical protein
MATNWMGTMLAKLWRGHNSNFHVIVNKHVQGSLKYRMKQLALAAEQGAG